MTGPTHVLIGLTAVVASGRLTGNVPGAWNLLAIILGSLAPDIDGQGTIAKPGRLFEPFLGWKVAKGIDIQFQALSSIIQGIFGHRGFIHAPLLGVLIIGAGVFWRIEWLVWFGSGYCLHLAGDYFTPNGIPLLSPFSTSARSGGRIRVGSAREGVLAALLVVFICAFGWQLLPDRIREAHLQLFQYLSSKWQ